jgi:hypothetical protein
MWGKTSGEQGLRQAWVWLEAEFSTVYETSTRRQTVPEGESSFLRGPSALQNLRGSYPTLLLRLPERQGSSN